MHLTVHEIISTIFQIYRSLPLIYQRFFHYIDHYPQYINDSTRDINLPTNHDNINTQLAPTFITILQSFLC
ncbi:hypothetical protein CBR58_16000 [Bacillus thuringiensis]|nr:hypothetical protein BK736_33855 [Bacillus thuringiensis serovar poloniensis]OTZ26559.1 hypothetical protein BK763_30530 [Bacillus thuringiensis serovar thompsoni]PNK46634.1 hypothetical protein CBR58_16000 [Bacillus thuringiensis]